MSHTDLGWEQIFIRLQRDREDFDAWQALERRVRAWLRGDACDRAGVLDDAVAEVLAAVFQTFDRARGPDTFRGFVHGHRLNIRRRIWSDRSAAVLSLDAVLPVPRLVRVDPSASLHVLDDVIEALPARERDALRLRYFDQLCTEDVADVLGVSQVNARQIVFQAVARLRRRLLSMEPASGAAA